MHSRSNIALLFHIGHPRSPHLTVSNHLSNSNHLLLSGSLSNLPPLLPPPTEYRVDATQMCLHWDWDLTGWRIALTSTSPDYVKVLFIRWIGLWSLVCKIKN